MTMPGSAQPQRAAMLRVAAITWVLLISMGVVVNHVALTKLADQAETTGRTLPSARIDLARLVTEVVQDSVPRALEQGIDLGFEGPDTMPGACIMDGNPTLLHEMVRNLVDNAIHYSGHGGVVTARVLADRFSGVQILQVEDDGPGIAEHERELVMQPFYRALGTNVDGSGLGLAIVQEIAQQHGATVTMEDTHPTRAKRGLRVSVRFAPAPAPDLSP